MSVWHIPLGVPEKSGMRVLTWDEGHCGGGKTGGGYLQPCAFLGLPMSVPQDASHTQALQRVTACGQYTLCSPSWYPEQAACAWNAWPCHQDATAGMKKKNCSRTLKGKPMAWTRQPPFAQIEALATFSGSARSHVGCPLPSGCQKLGDQLRATQSLC